MEWFIFASRLICQVCERLCMCCKDMRIHSHAFFCNLSMPFWVGDMYKSVWLNANIIAILHNLSESASHGRFTGNLGV
jgi:hypothetical protein